jgi:hypothetical protein
MDRATGGEISLLFLDASHFVTGCDFPGYIYGSVRRFVKTFSGRKRYNVLGALDFISKKVTMVTNDSYITARLVFIPPYSPNLNLIEGLWKLVKGKPRSRYYNRFELFREQIDSIINSTDNLNKEMVDRLIGEKVQLFDDLISINENSFRHNQEAA